MLHKVLKICGLWLITKYISVIFRNIKLTEVSKEERIGVKIFVVAVCTELFMWRCSSRSNEQNLFLFSQGRLRQAGKKTLKCLKFRGAIAINVLQLWGSRGWDQVILFYSKFSTWETRSQVRKRATFNFSSKQSCSLQWWKKKHMRTGRFLSEGTFCRTKLWESVGV